IAFLVGLLVALPVFAIVRPRALGWLLAPSVAVFGFVGLVSWLSQTIPSGAAADLIVGTLVALPLWFLGVCVGSDQKPGVGLLALQAGLLEIVSLETALTSLATPTTSDAFLTAWFQTVGHQLGALAAALSGNGLLGTQVIPLGAYADPWFVVLALLALAGLLLPMIGDVQGGTPTRPTPSRRDLAESVRTLPPPVLYAVAAEATPVRAPLGAGLAPAFGTALGVLGFLYVAASAPAYAFFLVTIGVVAAVLVLVGLASGPGRPAPPASAGPPRPAVARSR
ncbi:MAG: hypothetical protein L3J73_04845, partial [Thermoplasmata archaeon]|nr:hypothetical protein [Thermoplasmata archaeon]